MLFRGGVALLVSIEIAWCCWGVMGLFGRRCLRCVFVMCLGVVLWLVFGVYLCSRGAFGFGCECLRCQFGLLGVALGLRFRVLGLFEGS